MKDPFFIFRATSTSTSSFVENKIHRISPTSLSHSSSDSDVDIVNDVASSKLDNNKNVDTNKAIEELSKLNLGSKNSAEKCNKLSNEKSTNIHGKSRDGHLTKLSQNLENFSKKINSVDSQKSKDSEKSNKSNVKFVVANKQSAENNQEIDDLNREGKLRRIIL